MINNIFKHIFLSRRFISRGETFTVHRIFTDNDLRLFAELTGDWNEIHFHPKSEKSIVHGALLNGMISAALGSQLPGSGTVLLEQTLKFPNPCYVGENVQLTVEFTSVRKIIECKYTAVVGEKIVLHGVAKVMKKNPSVNRETHS